MRVKQLAIALLLLTAMASVARSQYTPSQIRQAYGLNSLAADGAGQTIAIIGAYDYPGALSALNTFSSQYGLQQFNVTGGPTFTVLDQNGGTSLPGTDSTGGWEGEMALDIEWAHAMAPKANIILYEASAPNNTNLFAAADTARNNAAVSVVSMSFGRTEYGGQTGTDATFTTPSSRLNASPRQGVTFVAGTGDAGPPSGYPATSPNVVAVGGTHLTLNGSNYVSETAWTSNGAGAGGPSAYEPKPAYQTSYGNLHGGVLATLTNRATPDVAFDADPSTGVNVYDPYNGGWMSVGGTSLSAPCWAGLIACANQLRTANGYGTLDGPSQTLPALYSLPSADFHDITTGTITGTGGSYSAGSGYDLGRAHK